MNRVEVNRVSTHVTQIAIPTQTLPPASSTNTYLVSYGSEGLIVDAGTPEEPYLRELARVVTEAGIDRVQLLATHYHRDHTHGIPWLQRHFDAVVFMHPLDMAPAAREMKVDAREITTAPPLIAYGPVRIHVEHAAGHTHGHLHLRVYPDRVILVGDDLAGAGSVWVGPPDGHLSSYYRALTAIEQGDCTVAGPGHGPVLQDAREAARLQRLHRLEREQEILAPLNEWLTIDEILDLVYVGKVPNQALGFARKTIQANLQYLLQQDLIRQRFNSLRHATQYRRV